MNIIGEHTDTSGGYVLPITIARRTQVEVARRLDREVHVWSEEVAKANAAAGASTDIEVFELGRETPRGAWLDYIQGTTRSLTRAGHAIGGFDAWITSDVPIGAGLSSSAALEVALVRALRTAFVLDIDDVAIAQVGRTAENEFVGVPSGIMDQMAASLGSEDAALFVDTRSLIYEHVALPPSIEVVVIDSGVAHGHAGGEYAKRREEVERAAYVLELKSLRDASDGDVRATAVAIATLSPPLDRRARHVVSENRRVLDAVVALRAGDEAALRALLAASHDSLRDDFEVSVPEVDRLVAIAQANPDVIGARMTGGGFGGAIVVLARRGQGRVAAARIRAAYGPSATIVVP